jgi:hypothetical protein
MTEQTLHDVLDRATDEIASPDLAATALGAARRRRNRRRGAVAALGSGLAVVTVVAAITILDKDGNDEPAPGGPTPRPTAGIPSEEVGELWDPFTVADEPLHPTVLPEPIEPPELPPRVSADPMEAAVVAWPEDGSDLRLLGTDGVWRCVPDTADAVTGSLSSTVRAALSSDGTKVAVSVDDGIRVVDVTTGDEQLLPWPDQVEQPWDAPPGLSWLPGDDSIAVLHWRETLIVGLDGESRRAPFGEPYGALAVDPDGLVVELGPAANELVSWRGLQEVGRTPWSHFGLGFSAGHGQVAFTGHSDSRHSGPMVADATTGELVAHAPILDPRAVYSDNGHLTTQGFLDEDTVLLLVGPIDTETMRPGDTTWHLVAWHFRTGDFERLASGGAGMQTIDVATQVLAAGWGE